MLELDDFRVDVFGVFIDVVFHGFDVFVLVDGLPLHLLNLGVDIFVGFDVSLLDLGFHGFR